MKQLTKNTVDLHIHDGHNSSLLVSDAKTGNILFGANEERYTHKKNQSGFPINSLKKSQEYLNFSFEDIQGVFYSSRTEPYLPTKTNSDLFRYLFLTLSPFLSKYFFTNKLISNFYKKISHLFRRKDSKKTLRDLGISTKNIQFYDHHYCHAASTISFLQSTPTKDVLIFTLDGSGDLSSGSIFIFNSGKLRIIERIHSLDSLGEIYSQATGLLNMKPLEHEYKLMGLAPYCKKEYAEKVYEILVKKVIKISKDKKGRTVFKSRKGLFGIPLRKHLGKELSGYRFDAIAAGIQLLVEKVVTQWIIDWINSTQINDIAISGGVFMNVKLNKLIAELPEVKKLTVVPSSGDESLVFGSLVASYLKNKFKLRNMSDYYNQGSKNGLLIGNSYSPNEVKIAIKDYESQNKSHEINLFSGEEIQNKIIDLLIVGKVGARFCGRMEFGARSLGNRSIICSPRDIKQIRIINEAIKSRDFWMPFAPVILDKYSCDYLKIKSNQINSYEFMQIAADSKEFFIENAPASIHPYDMTSRPQILRKEINSDFYDLIEKFKERTNVGCLLNTSFNLHGYPVVESPTDALEVFFNTGIDFLILENNLLIK